MITQMRLKELLNYSEETGDFHWEYLRPGYKYKHRKTAGGYPAGSNTSSHGYLSISIDGHPYLAHRLAWLYVNGCWPIHEVDHINHSRVDNRIKNLRIVTRSENTKNKSMHINNTSGVTGVSWDGDRSKWVARISIQKKNVALGRFDDIWDAICSRKAAENLTNYHPNHGRAVER